MAIQHPNIFYLVLDGSWSSYNSLEFWNSGNTAINVNNNKVYKTIYDPSPINYTIPKPAAFTGFTTTGQNSTEASQFNVSGAFSKGWNFYCQPDNIGSTIFFPALGIRDVWSGRVNTSTGGSLVGVDGLGSWWSTGPSIPPYQSSGFYCLHFFSNQVLPLYQYYRSYGMTANSVSE